MLCLATAIHSLKWVKITKICLVGDQTFTNIVCLNAHSIANNTDCG